MRAKKDLKSIEETLLVRKKELEAELARLYAEEGNDGQVQDPGDQAMTAIFESLKSSLQNNELEEYRMIVKALEQIKKGEYGMCVDCAQPISAKRLESYPNAARCVMCQEAEEDGSNQPSNKGFL